MIGLNTGSSITIKNRKQQKQQMKKLIFLLRNGSL